MSAWVISARRFGGGRVGITSASSTPARVACRPPLYTQNHSSAPSSMYGNARYTPERFKPTSRLKHASAAPSQTQSILVE